MHNDIEKILLSEQQIQTRIQELGEVLTKEYADKNPVIIGVLKGVVVFYADMIRRIQVPCQMDFMWISSYAGTDSTGKMLVRQDDVTVIAIKDYIKNPKPNGYRSYHMIIEIPVFFSDSKKPIRVEVQIRTIAMDFWASLDHQLKYKKSFVDLNGEISGELKQCADVIAQTDNKMLEIRKRIEAQGVTVSRD